MKPTGEFCHIEQSPVLFAKVKETGEEVKVVKTREFYSRAGNKQHWYDVYPYKKGKGYWESDLDFG